ncbi:MAG: hypothetical protein AAFX53_01280 [Bacteroidota bacterium]
MKSGNLLSQLRQMESMLNHFSFEELGVVEASELQGYFLRFKKDFEGKYLGEDTGVALAVPPANGITDHSMNTKHIQEIDFSPFLEDCLGDYLLLKESIDQHKNHVLRFIGEARIHITYGCLEDLALALQNIRVSLQLLRSKKLVRLTLEMQKNCNGGGHLKELKSLYIAFVEQYPRTEKAIERALARL